jgi:NADPH2:quinone reductase
MKAYMFTDQGPAIRETPKMPPKANQVLVKVVASALNRVDLVMAQGAPHGSRGGVGTVLGSEWAGEVVEIGPNVKEFAVGDRVMGSSGSAFADYVCAHVANVLPIPDPKMGYETAACFPIALRTMHDAIVTAGQFQPGQTVLIQGASSGVGLLGMQIAKVMGAKAVIGSSTDPGRRARLAEFGADKVIDSGDLGWPEQVLEYTQGQGVDLVVDQVSGLLVNGNMRATKVGGRVVNVGRLGGQRAEFNADLHALRQIRYIGVTFRTRTLEEIGTINRRMMEDLWEAFTAGKLTLPIDSAFPFAEVDQALGRMQRNQHFGKIVLRH